MDEDALDYATINRADHPALGGDHGGVRADTHGPRNKIRSSDDESRRGGHIAPAAARHRGDKFLFALGKRLEQIRERHLLVELRVADGDGGLVREDGDGFAVIVGEKIGVAAEQGEHAESALIVAQRQRVKTIFFVLFEEGDDLGAGVFRIRRQPSS